MKGVTKSQQAVIDYVTNFIQTHRHSPSFREIQTHFGFSSLGTVYRYIQILKRKGIFSHEKKCSRSLSLTPPPNQQKAACVPLAFIGTIGGASPIETFSDPRTLNVPEFMVYLADKTYVLQVIGNHLAEDRIIEGDFLLVEVRHEIHEGDTIVSLINQRDVIVKRYHLQGNYVHLSGWQAHQLPLIIKLEDMQIHGVLIGLLRNYT